MNRFLEVAKATALVAVALFFLAAAYTTWDAHRLIVQTTGHFDQILTQVGNTAQTVDLAAKEQKEYWATSTKNANKVLVDTRETVAKLNRILGRTDVSINQVLIPQVVTSLQQNNKDLHDVSLAATQSLSQLTKETVPLIQAAAATAENAAKATGDPAIKESMESLAKSGKNIEAATASLASIAKHGDETAEYYEKKLTTPKTFAVKVGGFLLDLFSKMGAGVSGFFKK